MKPKCSAKRRHKKCARPAQSAGRAVSFQAKLAATTALGLSLLFAPAAFAGSDTEPWPGVGRRGPPPLVGASTAAMTAEAPIATLPLSPPVDADLNGAPSSSAVIDPPQSGDAIAEAPIPEEALAATDAPLVSPEADAVRAALDAFLSHASMNPIGAGDWARRRRPSRLSTRRAASRRFGRAKAR